ncbi:Orf6 [Heliothis zea nudivirus]|uniref:Orf6 n=1 Tax=Heliothis zea nudivirus 1 TaxID=3116536 RepID=Q8JKV4_9VIRU|nr:Orf6 [Heliothis zea nudivirus]AAN04304.1 Orf6 [Heliothis zea nudivirus]
MATTHTLGKKRVHLQIVKVAINFINLIPCTCSRVLFYGNMQNTWDLGLMR